MIEFDSMSSAPSSPQYTARMNLNSALDVAWRFAVKDFKSRYRASVLGLGWHLLIPTVMLSVYTVVFFFVFTPKTSGSAQPASALAFGVQLWTGLALFLAFSDLCVRASRIMIDQANLVRKVVFPLSSLVLSIWLSMQFNLVIYVALLLALALAGGYTPTLEWLWIGPVLFIFLVNVLGFAFALAALGAYVRDLGHALPAAVGMLMFLTPIFYRMDQVPSLLKHLLAFNPLSWPIEALRHVLTASPAPAIITTVLYSLASMLMLAMGVALFQRLKSGFADVL